MATQLENAVEYSRAPQENWVRRNWETLMVIAAGLSVGGLAVWLSHLGNPANSGICISCFMENLAGSIGLHGNARMQYIRPELLGFVLGGTFTAMVAREFRAEGGSAPILRFLGGIVLIVGCAMFMGCPIKMMLRLGAGDFTAASGLVGLVAGIWVGFQFLRQGFYLGDARPLPLINGLVVPAFFAVLLLWMFLKPPFIEFSTQGPGSQKAPFGIALGVGLLIGFLAQKSRFCVTGTLGNFLMSRDVSLLAGVGSMFGSIVAMSLLLGSFHPGIQDQPGSHLSYGWSLLGMALVGFTSILLGGCPFRQLILSSQGSADAGFTVLGMLAGGAIVQGWGLGSTNLGPTATGKAATLLCFAAVLLVGLLFRIREEEEPSQA